MVRIFRHKKTFNYKERFTCGSNQKVQSVPKHALSHVYHVEENASFPRGACVAFGKGEKPETPAARIIPTGLQTRGAKPNPSSLGYPE